HSEIMAFAGANQRVPEDLENPVSFHLAGSLPLDLDFKQTLLSMRSEPERLDAVITAFESILPKLRRTVRIRQKAGGNGHSNWPLKLRKLCGSFPKSTSASPWHRACEGRQASERESHNGV